MKYTIHLTALITLLLIGCKHQQHQVVMATGTTIGVEIAQNPATQTPSAKLGYNRGELALVPSNRAGGDTQTFHGDGAKDTADAILELRYHGIFNMSESGIYQRVAVGPTAVAQPGAAFMFARKSDGTVSDATAASLAQAITGTTDPEISANLVPLSTSYRNSPNKSLWDAAAQDLGYGNFAHFALKPGLTDAEVRAMTAKLKEKGLIP